MPSAAAVGRFLAGRAPARANAPADPWDLIGRAVAGSHTPACPGAERVRRAVEALPRGSGSPLWESLVDAGLVPPGWASDPSRGFVTARGFVAGLFRGFDAAGRGSVRVSDRAHSVYPARSFQPAPTPGELVNNLGSRLVPSLVDAPDGAALAAAVAADTENVVRAEEFAREAAARMLPWGQGAVSRVGWQVLDAGDEHLPHVLNGPFDFALSDVLKLAADGPVDEEVRLDRLLHAKAGAKGRLALRYLVPVQRAAIAHLWWLRAGGEVRGVRCADAPSPFDPLLEIFALGYSALSPEGATFRLFVPCEVRRRLFAGVG